MAMKWCIVSKSYSSFIRLSFTSHRLHPLSSFPSYQHSLLSTQHSSHSIPSFQSITTNSSNFSTHSSSLFSSSSAFLHDSAVEESASSTSKPDVSAPFPAVPVSEKATLLDSSTPSYFKKTDDVSVLPPKLSKLYSSYLSKPCLGCGALFQNQSPDSPGYLPVSKFIGHFEKLDQFKRKNPSLFPRSFQHQNHDIELKEKKSTLEENKEKEGLLNCAQSQEAFKLNNSTPPQSVLKDPSCHLDFSPIGLEKDTHTDSIISTVSSSSESVSSTPKPLIKRRIYDFDEDVETSDFDFTITSDAPSSSASEDAKALRGLRHNPTQLICQRCHDIQYSNTTNIAAPRVSPSDLQLSHYSHALFLQIVDILDFPLSFFPISHRLPPPNSHYLLLFNKVDLVPSASTSSSDSSSIHQQQLRSWMERMTNQVVRQYKSQKPYSVHAISSKSGEGIKEVFETIHKLKVKYHLKDVAVLGATNVGKSEFLSCLHRMVRFPKLATPNTTRARIHGTTIAPLSFPLSRFSGLMRLSSHTSVAEGGDLIDTPGVHLEGIQLTSLLPVPQLTTWHVTKPLKWDQAWALPLGTSLMIGNLARIDVVAIHPLHHRVQFTLGISSTVPIHATQMAKAHKFCETQLPSFLDPSPPSTHSEETRKYELANTYEIQGKLKKEPKASPSASIPYSSSTCVSEIVLGGIGCIGVSGDFENVILEVYTVGGKGVDQRTPLVSKFGPRKVKKALASRKLLKDMKEQIENSELNQEENEELKEDA